MTFDWNLSHWMACYMLLSLLYAGFFWPHTIEAIMASCHDSWVGTKLSPLRLCSLLRMLSDTQFLVTAQGRNLDLIRSLLILLRQIYDDVSLLSLMCYWHRRWGVGFAFSVLSGYEDYALHKPRGTTLMICK